MLMNSHIRRFRRAEKGIAAIEFALVLPLLTLTTLAIFELTLRFQIADELERYTFQAGDILSRSTDISGSDFDDIYDLAPFIMPSLDMGEADLSITLTSVGYQSNGDPIRLWSRSRGTGSITFDLADAEELAPAGQSVLVAQTRLSTPTMFSVFGAASMSTTSVAIFKPRTTRAIAMDGELTDGGTAIEGYEDE